MRLNYFQKIIFSILEIVAGCINLLKSLVGLSPNCDLDGLYLKAKMERVREKVVSKSYKQRENAENEYRKRVTELTSR